MIDDTQTEPIFPMDNVFDDVRPVKTPGTTPKAGPIKHISFDTQTIGLQARRLSHLIPRQAVRIGEASIASFHPHAFTVEKPAEIRVLKAQDAGAVFYGLRKPKRVLHIDIFHEPGFVDHFGAARSVMRGFTSLTSELHMMASPVSQDTSPSPYTMEALDYVDIQTGTGGGRLTGRLIYGKGASVRQTHMNHIHIAMAWNPLGSMMAFCMIWFLEQEILSQGLELRCIQSIVNASERIDREALKNHCSSGFDSFLSSDSTPKTGDSHGTKCKNHGGDSPAPLTSGKDARSIDDSRGVFENAETKGGIHKGPSLSTDTARFRNNSRGTPSFFGRYGPDTIQLDNKAIQSASSFVSQLTVALDAMEPFLSSNELKETLESVNSEGRPDGLLQREFRPRLEPQVEESLAKNGLVKREGQKLKLTERGQNLLGFLNKHWPEIDCEVRRIIRRLPPGVFRSWGLSSLRLDEWGRRRAGRGYAVPVEISEWPGELAAIETVTTSLKRNLLGRISEAPENRCALNPSPPPHGTIQKSDIFELLYPKKETRDVCILLDASSSMAGKRIGAAKRLAAHILLQGRNRACVIVFKDSFAEIKLPLTRFYRKAVGALSTIQASGLTPLAAGLIRASEYLPAQHCRRPVIIMITDGIPTIGTKGSPTMDAIEAACRLKELGIELVSIGLEPNRAFLEELSAKSQAKLYILKELEGKQLVGVIHKECKV
jgi:Mg-chelatase subunit ChlD